MRTEIRDQKERSHAIKDMLTTRGWEIIEREMIDRSQDVTNQLLDAKDQEEMRRLQAEAKALREFFTIITSYASMKTE